MPNRHSDSEEPGSTVVRRSIVGFCSIAFWNMLRSWEGERCNRGCIGIKSSGEGMGLNGGKEEGVSAMVGRIAGRVMCEGGRVTLRVMSGFRMAVKGGRRVRRIPADLSRWR